MRDLIYPHFLVPGGDGKMFGLRREGEIRDAVVRRCIERNVFGYIAERIGLARRAGGSKKTCHGCSLGTATTSAGQYG